MSSKFDHILAKGEDFYKVTLVQHLKDVASCAKIVARNLGLDEDTAYKGAILHDIGKVSPLFQRTIEKGYFRQPGFIFRHEIASLFFISLVPKSERPMVIDMVVAHHKSIYKDVRELGILDLDDTVDCFEIHSKEFEKWSDLALEILEHLGLQVHAITIEEARKNYNEVIDYCEAKEQNYSIWKGVLQASDYYASALGNFSSKNLEKLFILPDLSFYNRKNELYPLSKIPTHDDRKHTLVTAPTGAGKTDFLLRRCRGRVFYTLPFQASINAMYERIKTDLSETNAEVRLLHASSNLKLKDGKVEERILQRHIGASVKVLTPHQMFAIGFGIKGYEAMIVDLKGADVILDEIHTYSNSIQSIVLKVVEVLIVLNCRIHIGTATMPTVLYNKILKLLGGEEKVYEVKLSNDSLDTFNRHIVYKLDNYELCECYIDDAVSNDNKILIVCNQVSRAQNLYLKLKEEYSDVPIMLIHSRYKRNDRFRLETKLKDEFNLSYKSCIVVSTQVVEVSLDISFDIMITECAPIDALVQRFGRVNRKRTKDTIGKYKPIYVLAPPINDKEALPYDKDVLIRSFDALPNGDLLNEIDVQEMLDIVYPEIEFTDIDMTGVVLSNNKWMLKELWHRPKSALLEVMDIDSAVCIVDSDKESYKDIMNKSRSGLEIPISYRSIAYRKLDKIDDGMRPFVIPNKSYSKELGLLLDYAKPEYYITFEIL